MNPLNMINAFVLYGILRKHVPSGFMGMQFIDAIHKMIDNMMQTDCANDYVSAIAIMNNTDIDTIVSTYENDSHGLLAVFIDGIKINHFFDLVSFCDMVLNYGR